MNPSQNPYQPTVVMPDAPVEPAAPPAPMADIAAPPVPSPQPPQTTNPVGPMPVAPPAPAYTQPAMPAAPQPLPVSSMPAFMQAPDPLMQQTAPDVPGGIAAGENPDKKYLTAVLLACFLGLFAADRFYLGKTKTAFPKLLTLGGLGVWAILDIFLTAFGKQLVQNDPRPLEGFAADQSWVKVLAVVMASLYAILIGGFLILVIVSTINSVQSVG